MIIWNQLRPNIKFIGRASLALKDIALPKRNSKALIFLKTDLIVTILKDFSLHFLLFSFIQDYKDY